MTDFLSSQPVTSGMCTKCAVAPDCDRKCQGMLICPWYESRNKTKPNSQPQQPDNDTRPNR